jgi:UDP-N-acetylglucosamine/UDP-N-acetylgalactosamine diphosphorylase
MFSIGPVSGASLFQILLEKIGARSRAAGMRIPLYLMTSPATHDESGLRRHASYSVETSRCTT